MSLLKIKVINVEVTDSGKYKMAEVSFKNLDTERTESRKIPSFKNPDVFKTLTNAKNGDVFTVSTVKDGQFWQWEKINAGENSVQEPKTQTSGATAAPRSTYETPEERAKKQVYITRLSALNTATAGLAIGGKAPPKGIDVIALAKQYEAYVMGTDALTALSEMANDLPPPVSLD